MLNPRDFEDGEAEPEKLPALPLSRHHQQPSYGRSGPRNMKVS